MISVLPWHKISIVRKLRWMPSKNADNSYMMRKYGVRQRRKHMQPH